MEALISQFTFLSDQALQHKNFDPSTIEDLMKLFEIEAYKSWAAMELQHHNEAQDAEIAMQQAEDYLDSVMEDAMDEFRRFEEEFDRMAEAELQQLLDKSEKARKMGSLMEKAAAVASKRYMEAAMNSATASMRSAWKAISSNKISPAAWFFEVQDQAETCMEVSCHPFFGMWSRSCNMSTDSKY